MCNNQIEAGFLCIDKPATITSFGVVARCSRALGIKKMGHAGSLDPFATGVLILAFGKKATTKINTILEAKKQYRATICLGKSTVTDDFTGELLSDSGVENIQDFNETLFLDNAKNELNSMIGSIEQIPSTVSAKKINGQKAYNLVRQGKEFELKPKKVNIYSIKVIDSFIANEQNKKYAYIDVLIDCSSGTYIRAIARDLGNKFGCGGILTKLVRTKIGNILVEDCNKISATEFVMQEKLRRYSIEDFFEQL